LKKSRSKKDNSSEHIMPGKFGLHSSVALSKPEKPATKIKGKNKT
jgi:hypothetical protein